LRVQIIQLQWKQNVLHQSLQFLSLSLHLLLEHQKNLQLHKSVPVNHHLPPVFNPQRNVIGWTYHTDNLYCLTPHFTVL
jgi:hypothetical protein